jgi:signal transduction histidine kinase
MLVVAITGFATLDAVERIGTLTARFEHAELDDLLLGLALAMVLATWFAARRWHESRMSLQALRASEQLRESYVVRLEQLSGELLLAEERERNRIAALVHDEIGQPLYACRLRLSLLQKAVPDGATRAMCDELDELTREALERARDLTLSLSPPALTELGLRAALETLGATLARRYGVPIAVESSPGFDAVPESARGALFHSIKELVLNAVKHAQPTRIAIGARTSSDAIELHVDDDGCGFDAAPAALRTGFGLFSIERRIACLDGTLAVRSTPGSGTRAVLSMPAGRLPAGA